MSTTPRTDGMMKFCFGDDREYVRVDDVAQLERELEEANRDARLLREQCRVGDVAFQHLHATSHGQQVPDWVNDGLPNLYTLLSQLTSAKSALEKARDGVDLAMHALGGKNPSSCAHHVWVKLNEALTTINAALGAHP